MKDYTGKRIYLGIDVHKSTYTITAICEKMVVKKATISADPEGLVKFCKKFFSGAEIASAYEAGFSGFSLHRILCKNDVKNIVIHAASIEVAVGDRVKTDKRDSYKIASLLADGRLKGIRVPSEEEEEKRTLTRLRDNVLKHRTTITNQIKSFLHLHGLSSPSIKRKISLKLIKSLKEMPMKDGIRYALDQLSEMWQQLTDRIKEIDIRLAEQAKQDKELEIVYRSAPGFGPIGARILANEMGDIGYFKNERELFSYTGLTPSEYSSGEHIRKGHISHQGKPLIRRVLVQAAWKAIKIDAHLKEVFDRISSKAGKKKAIVAVARRLIGHIRACFIKRCLYDTKFLLGKVA
jgi:transposase